MRRIITIMAIWCLSGSLGGALALARLPPGGKLLQPAAAQPSNQPSSQPPDQPPDPTAEQATEPTGPSAEPAELTAEQRAAYAAALRQLVQDVRGKVLDTIVAKIQRKQAQKMDRMAAVIWLFALSGGLLLFLPFALRKKYPRKMGVMFRYSALAALLFYLAVSLFGMVLVVLRNAQIVAGKYTNPQVQLVSSTFDLIERKADEMAEVGPILIEPTLQSLSGESDQPVLVTMLENIQKLRNDVSVFTSIGRLVKKLDWLLGLLPILFTGLAMLLFARAARPTLTEIARLPERAAQGERMALRHTVRVTLQNVWAEARATFCVLGVLIGLTLLATYLLGFVLEPAIEIFMAYLALAFYYIQVDPAASSFWILFSLMGTILFLVLNLAVIVTTTILFLARSQTIFQQRFRAGVPLRAHRRFWRWGIPGAVWTQVLPVLYIAVAVKAIGWFVEKSVDKFLARPDPNWPFVLSTGPALFLVTFLLIFWIGRGLSALHFLATYRADGQAYAAVIAAEHTLTTAGVQGA